MSVFVGTSADHESKTFSVARCVQAIMRGQRLSGIEAERQSEAPSCYNRSGIFHPPSDDPDLRRLMRDQGMASDTGWQQDLSCWIPLDAFFSKRDLTAQVASAGGNFIGTQVLEPVEILRKKLVAGRAGTQFVNVRGNPVLPRQTGAATISAVNEQGTLVASSETTDQISIQPRRIGATVNYSRQLLLQSAISIDQWISSDLLKVAAIKMDYNILQGPGGTSPAGILHTNGIGSQTFGATPTFAKIVGFEKTVADQNGDVQPTAWVCSTATRAKLRQQPKVAGGTAGPTIWEDGPVSDEGRILGSLALATTNVDGDLVYYGRFADSTVYLYGFDLVTNPFSGDTSATVRITLNAFCDVVIRHPGSFCVSTDSGAQ